MALRVSSSAQGSVAVPMVTGPVLPWAGQTQDSQAKPPKPGPLLALPSEVHVGEPIPKEAVGRAWHLPRVRAGAHPRQLLGSQGPRS